MSVRRFALLGSGEFLPWSSDADRWLLERSRSGTVLVAPTAAAPEGEDVFARWGRMGLDHYAGLGVSAELLELRTREDALRSDVVARLADAAMVFFSGGNPAYLAETLSGTPFWSELVAALDDGLVYAGCSAGVAALGERAPDSGVMRFSEDAWRDGLRLFPRTVFGPHWDAIDAYLPGATAAIASSVPAGSRLFAIDEETAALGDGRRWEVLGAGAVHLLADGAWRTARAGESFELEALEEPERTGEPA